MRRYLLLALAASFLAFAGGACGSGDDDEAAQGEGGGGGTTIELSATEFAFDPMTVEVEEPGTYTFRLVNDGSTVHALEVEGHGIEEETEDIQAGQSADLTVDLTEPGEYELYCPVGNHRDQGMEGTLVVGGAGAGGTMTDETTTDDHTTTEDSDETTTEEDSGYNYR
jgi:plastocyanin